MANYNFMFLIRNSELIYLYELSGTVGNCVKYHIICPRLIALLRQRIDQNN